MCGNTLKRLYRRMRGRTSLFLPDTFQQGSNFDEAKRDMQQKRLVAMRQSYKVVNGEGEGHKRSKMMRLKLGERTSRATGEVGWKMWERAGGWERNKSHIAQ